MTQASGNQLIPPLETARLRLRGHRADDLQAFAAIWSDPQVTRYLGAAVSSTVQDAWLRMLRYPGLWALLGYGYWAIEEKASGRCIGDVGYADFKRAIEPPLDGMLEMGWVLAADCHGKGYASEASTAVLAWGDAHLPGRTAVCMIESGNVDSIRLDSKLGFVFWQATTFHGASVQLMRR